MANNAWHILLSRDGTVLDALGAAPRSWVGSRLDLRDDVSQELKQAVHDALLRANNGEADSVPPGSGAPGVQLTVVDAVPLRCAQVSVRDVLRSSLQLLRQQAQTADIALTVNVDDDVPAAVRLDRAKIAWAVTALVGNALRYVRRGSQTMPGGSIFVHATYDAGLHQMSIEVRDDGPGIPADKLRCLFGVGPDSSGMALALAMVRDVVAAHGGTFAITSDVTGLSRGTVVRLTLPVGG